MLFRLLAVVGLPAHLISRFSGFLLGLVGIQLPVVALLIGALALLAGLEAWDNYQQLTERPEPRQATVAEIVEQTERRQVIWLTFSGEIAAEPFVREVPVLGSGVHELGRRVYFYYLALDPDDPEVGLIVRSLVDDDHFRARTLTARIVEDAAFVEDALDRLDLPAAIQVHQTRYLEELAEVEPADDELTPGELTAIEAGSEVTVAGRIPAPARIAACAPPEEAAGCEPADAATRWVYLLADPADGMAMVLRSAHSPDAIPVNLDGLVLTDTFRTNPVIESDWLAELRDDLRYPQTRVLFHGAAPPFPEPRWTGVLVPGGIALLLLVSLLAGYPIFRRTAASAQVPSLSPGEQLQVEMHGSMETERARSPVDGALGVVERMTLPDLVVTLWRYGQAERGEPRSKIEDRVRAEARGRETRMVVHVPGRSQLAVLGDRPAQVETGTVYRVMNSRPALHLDDERVDLLLVFDEELGRDRAALEIVRETADR